MKKNINKYRIITCCCLLAMALGYAACSSAPREKTQHDDQVPGRQSGDNDSLMTLIPDYSGMREDDTVAAAWTEEGFKLAQCRQIKVYPVLNYSRVDHPGIQENLEAQLQKIFT